MGLTAGVRASLYHELHRYVQAGLSLPRAIDSYLTEPSLGSLRTVMERVHHRFSEGAPIEVAFQDPAFSKIEQAMIGAAETSGRIESAMGYLAKYFETINQTNQEIRGKLAYPIFLMHFAAVTLPLPKIVDGLSVYLIQVIAILGAAYGVIATVWFTCWLLAFLSETDSTVDSVVFEVPVFGSTRRKFAFARFFASLEMLLNSGVSIPESMTRAAATTRSASIQGSITRAVKEIEVGVPVDQALRKAGGLPEQVLRGVHVGLETGTLDIEMGRWAKYYWEKASDGIKAVAQWVPRLIYLVIVLAIGWQIIKTVQGYYSTIEKLGL